MKTSLLTKICSVLLIIALIITMCPLSIFALDDDMGEEEEIIPFDVYSADELEEALSSSEDYIRILQDIVVDRTFFITRDVTIFTETQRTLTRSPSFDGDMFIIGKDKDGNLSEENITLTLGEEESLVSNLLIIDGNKDNMEIDVCGSVFFVCKNAIVNLYEGVTVQNCFKVGNDETLTGLHTVSSYGTLVGGAVMIVAGGGTANIYGGNYTNNSVNTEEKSAETGEANSSIYGGTIFNHGTLNIYGGVFANGHAVRAGAIYNYRTLNLYSGQITGNTATGFGGAIYVPNTDSAFTYIGEETSYGDSFVTFSANSSVDGGGAIYAKNILTTNNTAFIDNSTDNAGGAIYATASELSLSNTTFESNIAAKKGGAIFVSGLNKSDALELTISTCSFKSNVSQAYGGAIYLTEAESFLENVTFTANSSQYGGGIYGATGDFEINSATATENISTKTGGFISLNETSYAKINKINASNNQGSSGGAIYVGNSGLDVFDSTFTGNQASSGGAINIYLGSYGKIYNSVFDSNTSTANGAALNIYTDAYEIASILHSCTFTNNTANAYGGALYISKASIAEMYNATAKNNSADKGGFFYITTTNTTLTLAGANVYGNTAVSGGPIIWGNLSKSILRIDKSKWVDMANTGDWDDAYWSAAIYNLVTVKNVSVTIPSYIGYDGKEVIPEVITVPADVTTAAQLERAIEAGHTLIRIAASFEIDRTFYIKNDLNLFSSAAVTLTRNANFGGDIFVVGENEDGTLVEVADNDKILFTIGNEESKEKNLLVFDGNKDNMNVTVAGTVFFVLKNSQVELYNNFSAINCKKNGNSKTNNYSDTYISKYPIRVGGAVGILTSGSTMNIYGGEYKNNTTNDITDSSTEEGMISSYGGAFFNHGTINVYGGTFEGNHAARAAVFYNYRSLNIYNAEIKNNSASSLGGVIYMPSSDSAITNIGLYTDLCDSNVIFSGNSAETNGGVIYAQNKLNIENASLINNQAGKTGGAIYATGTKANIANSKFEDNVVTGTYGGAIYLTSSNGTDIVELSISNSLFNRNSSQNNGGAIYVTSTARLYTVKTDFTNNTSNGTYGGGAVYATNGTVDINKSTVTNNSTTALGGFVAGYSGSNITLNAITADGNSASGGGLAYVKDSTFAMYNSNIKNGSATSSHGGAVYVAGTGTGAFYATTFEGNTTKQNGGALALYNKGTLDIIHSCTFLRNSSEVLGGAMWISNANSDGPTVDIYNITGKYNSSDKGGFMYITVMGTEVKLVGATVQGNTATSGGPIIWGNSFNAVLNIDKSKYTDLDVSGPYNDAYWSNAIYNKLTVNDISDEVPKYLDYGNEPYDHMSDATDVRNSAELEAAINSTANYIRIVADFEIDRTFYIGRNVTIFSTAPYVLTRAADFTGDIFVVGESAKLQGSLVSNGNVIFKLGNPLSVKENLLTFDGNSKNMKDAVKGTVLFITNSSIVELYDNVTITNCNKTDNELTHETKYNLPKTNRIGGAGAIIHSGSLNIYGGNYTNNSVKDEDTSTADDSGRNSTLGGLIYNYSNVVIHGGNFEGNVAARGAIIYNYRTVRIYGGTFKNNHATVNGGVIYCPNTAASHVYIGTEYNVSDNTVLFENNTSVNHGGALYTSSLCAMVIKGKVTFTGNKSLEGSGGALAVYGQLTSVGTTYKNNSAYTRGGAAYVANSSNTYTTRFIKFQNCTFTSNNALLGGAINAFAGSSSINNGAILNVENCTFSKNAAAKNFDSPSSAFGGAIVADRKSTLNVNNSKFTSNTAANEGGAIYIAGQSTATINGSTFTSNSIAEGGTHGGAIVVRSSKLTADNITLNKNSSINNGGAIYISYQSSAPINSSVTIKNSIIKNNYAGGNAGAIYATRQTVEEEKRILSVSDTEFTANSAEVNAGAVQLATNVDAFFKNVKFVKNSTITGSGGAVYTLGAIATFETAEFSENTSGKNGGAVRIDGAATITIYDILATKNSAITSGGFMYNDDGALKVYDSTFKENTAITGGGAFIFYNNASAEIYGSDFISNTVTGQTSSNTGGALTFYNQPQSNIIHSCTFTGNSAYYGGVIYASNKSQGSFYNITATNNSAQRGGFFYETVTGTNYNIAGLTVSGNTDVEGGPIIWGNSNGAVLNIDKSKYTDNDAIGTLDDAYWSAAIYNLLTVNYVTLKIPTYKEYVPSSEKVVTPTEKKPVPVTDVLNLAANSTDGYISATYDKFEKLENNNNFLSKNTATFENINGNTVTVDNFVYPYKGTADNCNFSQGLLIYQAILYKNAHPEEDVYIDISSYRMSVTASININPNSRYYGYMRNLSGKEYDTNGFVRISYLLITAAKMGIHVNVVAHIDGYPMYSGDPNLNKYFTSKLNDPCDPAYVENGVISDYLDFNQFNWTLQNKGGTDMMHTKMCAVSHYLDWNGVEHKNAVWSSSSNLDGVRSEGWNANYKLQTATIITGHAEIYRTATNYLRLIANYKEQEQVYEFHDTINQINTYQIDMINAGRIDEIPEDERIVYLGTENDKIFELYFTPFGGDNVVWDETHNPYCKYLRKMYNSEDYILFSWNTAEYNGNFPLGQQIEEIITTSFHDNRNPNNRFYAIMNSYDPAHMSDLKVGTDIGFFSLNKRDFGLIHNKDMQMSYVENGQRYYVSLLNSCNIHTGSMCYQSNFMLVIKETECMEDGVFFNHAINTTTGIVDHDYGELKTYIPEGNEHGYSYRECKQCDEIEIIGELHKYSDWITDREVTALSNGIEHKECTVCGELLETRTNVSVKENVIEMSDIEGKIFTTDVNSMISLPENKTPFTIEATVYVPKSLSTRAGVIVGNHNNSSVDELNFEIYTNGNPRIYYVANGKIINTIFSTDIRSDEPQHIAVTIDGTLATLYVAGEPVETKQLKTAIAADLSDFKIGGDNRKGNAQYFKGAIHSIALFNDVRTAEEIKLDSIYVVNSSDNLIYSEYFVKSPTTTTVDTVINGKVFSNNNVYTINNSLSSSPRTLEATILAPKNISSAMGVIVGNNNGSAPFMNLEIYTEGRVRLLYNDGSKKTDHIFSTDIRSDSPVNIAVTISGVSATLYVNGVAVETATVSEIVSDITNNFIIGGDNTSGNYNYFKGTIYSVNLFDDVRTESEIYNDAIFVSNDESGLLSSVYFTSESTDTALTAINNLGQTFNASKVQAINKTFDAPIKTFEAVIKVPTTLNNRGGVVLSNYSDGSSSQVSVEIYNQGKVRLFYTVGSTKLDYLFSADIRSDKPTHIAITVEGLSATLYVNGEFSETKTLTKNFPDITSNMMVGGDRRSGNSQYFKGTIYSAALYSDIRTAEEIKQDSILVSDNSDALLYNEYFATDKDNNSYVYSYDGRKFTNTNIGIVDSLSSAPKTIEASLLIPTEITSNAGVIFSNYTGDTENQLSFGIGEQNRVELKFVSNGVNSSYLFNSSVDTGRATNVSITLDGNTATLFIDGKSAETAVFDSELPEITQNIKIGGDNTTLNPDYFKGTIYCVNAFSDIRTDLEILSDSIAVLSDADALIYSDYYVFKENDGFVSSVVTPVGMNYTPTSDFPTANLQGSPYTIEATIQLSKSMNDRAGVIVGNYGSGKRTQISLEIYTGGRVRLFYVSQAGRVDCIFNTDIRSDNAVNIAVTLKDNLATLYVNGNEAESLPVSYVYDLHAKNLKIGSDFRSNNSMYFKGTIYSVKLFSEVRTAEQIKSDMLLAAPANDTAVYRSQYASVSNTVDISGGRTFAKDDLDNVGNLSNSPYTIEAVVNVPKTLTGRGGVIVGNYGSGSKSQISLEIYEGGRVRLFYVAMSKRTDCIFTTDIRSDSPVHIAVTLNGNVATLYIDGVAAECSTLDIDYKVTTNKFTIGGDNRSNNSQYFKGTIYSVALFSDVRTAEEIKNDANGISEVTDSLICYRYYSSEICQESASKEGHRTSDWIIDSEGTGNIAGIKHKECVRCSKLLTVSEHILYTYYVDHIDYSTAKGLTFANASSAIKTNASLSSAPVTFEAAIKLPTTFSSSTRGGVILGNYDGSGKDCINIEIYMNGHPRIYYKVGSVAYSHEFTTDIRSNSITHLAITIDGTIAKLYINGVLKETAQLSVTIPKVKNNFYIGNDQRTSSSQYFRGTIYSINMFSDVRTDAEIALDAIYVTKDTEGLVYSKNFMIE